MALPYLRWFPADYLAATVHLSLEEDGLYRRLLDLMWMEHGKVPSDEGWLRKRLRLSTDQWNDHWPAVHEIVDDDGEWITQKRLRREVQRAKRISERASEAGRRSAELRRHLERSAELREGSGEAPPPDRSAELREGSGTDPPEGNGRSTDVQRTFNERSTGVQRAFNGRATIHIQKQIPDSYPAAGSASTDREEVKPPPAREADGPSAVDSIRIDVDATAGEVMNYWNDLTERCWSAESSDGEYLRERLLEGHSFDACCQVVEAAIASGIDHPRRAFSRERFGALLATRKDPRQWAELRDEFDAVHDRYVERTA